MIIRNGSPTLSAGAISARPGLSPNVTAFCDAEDWLIHRAATREIRARPTRFAGAKRGEEASVVPGRRKNGAGTILYMIWKNVLADGPGGWGRTLFERARPCNEGVPTPTPSSASNPGRRRNE